MERRRLGWKSSLNLAGFLCVLGAAGYLIFSAGNLRVKSGLSKQLDAEFQKIKDAGEPVTVAELVPPDLPDGENGALVYHQAFYLLKELKGTHREEWQYIPYEGGVKWSETPEEEKEKVRALLLKDPDFLRFYQLLEKASGKKCRFLEKQDYEKGLSMLLPHLSLLRTAARMLAARADLQAEKGDTDTALYNCLTGLKISGSLAEEPVLISGLVRIAIDGIVLDRLEEIMRTGTARPEMCRALLEKIAEERNDTITYRGFLGERVLFGQVFSQMKRRLKEKKDLALADEVFSKEEKGKIAAAARKNPDRFLDENELTYFQIMDRFIALAKKPYLETKEGMAGLENELAQLPDEKAALVKLFIQSLFQTPLKEADLDARLGSAEIALACRLYKAKNKKYPASLDELTPEFLPELPLNPFTGKDYFYRKTDKGFQVSGRDSNLKDGSSSDKLTEQLGDARSRNTEADLDWEE